MKTREEYVRDYIESARRLKVDLEPPTQHASKTAEAAFAVDSYPVEPGDEPAERSPKRSGR